MLNQIVVIGRLTADLNEEGDVAVVTLAIPRETKNDEGIYECDFIPIEVKGSIKDNMKEYCHKGDLIGVKGKIRSDADNKIKLLAEKITFLSSKLDKDKE